MNITKERIKEILSKYNSKDKDNHDLFNWCEEYKSFINDNIAGCISLEVEYILKRSYEDTEAPLSYEDLDLFDIDKAKEHLIYEYEQTTGEEQELFLKKAEDDLYHNLDTQEKRLNRFKEYINNLSKEELKTLFDKLELDTIDANAEIYEYWIITEPLKYRLEQEGEIFLKGGCVDIWCRQTTGQAISLDSCCINAFINLLKDNC